MKKYFTYSLAIFIAIILFINNFQQNSKKNEETDYNFIKASMLGTLKNLAVISEPEYFDLEIAKVAYKKVSDPTENYNFYKYTVNVFIKNNGKSISDEKVLLSVGNGNEPLFISNSDDGFSLKSNDEYIYRSYPLALDGRYNSGDFNFKIQLLNREEKDLLNNSYSIKLFESKPLIKDLRIVDTLDDGSFVVKFMDLDYSFSEKKIEVFKSSDYSETSEKKTYLEADLDNHILSYFTIVPSKNAFDSETWQPAEFIENEDNSISVLLYEDPLNIDKKQYFYIRSTDTTNNNFKISPIVKLLPNKTLTRAQFAKSFVNKMQIPLEVSGFNHFNDVSGEESYAPYIQTLINLGLTDLNQTDFEAEKNISRSEAVKIVFDYFDLDLSGIKIKNTFDDIGPEDPIYPYTAALSSIKKDMIFAAKFYPESDASIEFIKFLLDANIKNI